MLSTASGRSGMIFRKHGPSWILFLLSAASYAFLVRLTLYVKASPLMTGPNSLLIPGAVLASLVLWFFIACRLIGGRLAVATFSPMLVASFFDGKVLALEGYAGHYSSEGGQIFALLLGLPALTLLLQVGVWVWIQQEVDRRWSWILLGVLLVGLALRWAGMGWGLPFAFQPEETSIYFRYAVEAALGNQWNPQYFENPSLFIYLVALELTGIFDLARALGFDQASSALYLLFRGDQGFFYGLGRLNSVLLGTATVFVVYLMGRRLWNERSGVLAAALLAVNFLHVRNSQYAVNDVPSTFFLVLSLYFSVCVAEKGRWRDYVLAGVMAGLAASTKYNAGMVVASVAVAHWSYHRGLIDSVRSKPLAKLGASAMAALAGFVAGTPYSLLDFDAFRKGFMDQVAIGQAAWSGQSPEPTAWLFLTGVVQSTGLIGALMALLGAWLLLARNRSQAGVLLSFLLSYFAFMSAMALFFVRWVVPATPVLALCAAYGLDRILASTPGRRRYLVGVALVAVTILQPVSYSIRLDWLAHQEDTRQQANAWAEQQLPPGSKVAIEAFSLVDQEALSFRPTLRELDLELAWRATMHDLSYYRQYGFDYLVVSSFMYDRAFTQPNRYGDRVEFYQQLDRELSLLALFSPRDDGQFPPYALDDLDTPFWHLFYYDRPGPTIKVYRLRG